MFQKTYSEDVHAVLTGIPRLKFTSFDSPTYFGLIRVFLISEFTFLCAVSNGTGTFETFDKNAGSAPSSNTLKQMIKIYGNVVFQYMNIFFPN